MPSWNDPLDLIRTVFPGAFDQNDLTPLYERIYSDYQAVDADNIMFFEPGQFPDEIPGIVFHLGFKTPPGGQIGSPTHVLNDHTYCCQLNPSICAETGEPGPETAQKCFEWHTQRITKRDQDAQKLGIPLIISEFGACMDSDNCAREVDQVADVCDDALASWAYWEFKPFHDLTTSAGDRSEGFYNKDGTLEVAKVKSLVRTYVKKAQGKLEKMSFIADSAPDAATITPGTFSATITIDTSIDAPSEIHAFQDPTSQVNWYPNGYSLKLTSSCDAQPDIKQTFLGNTILLQVMNQECDGQTLTIDIAPK